MMIGSLGSIPFYTSIDESVLINNLDWASVARYAEHTRHTQTDMLEFVGNNPDKITFEITLSAFLGVNPTKMLDRLNALIRNHEAVKFVLGTMPIPGHWIVTDLGRQMEHLHQDGTLLSCVVKITLMEYVTSVEMPIISNRLSFTDRLASATTVYPTAGADGRPVIAASDKPAKFNPTPPTVPKNNLKNAAKLVGTVVGLGIKAVKKVTEVAKKYNVVEVLKNAISNRNYNATKATPAKPVVDRKDSGVNPNSPKHSNWVPTAR